MLGAGTDSDGEYDATESESDEDTDWMRPGSGELLIGLSVSERAMAHLKERAEKELRKMQQTIAALRRENSLLKATISDQCLQHETQRTAWKRTAIDLKRQVVEASSTLNSWAHSVEAENAASAASTPQQEAAHRAAWSPSRDDVLLTPDASCARINASMEKRDAVAVLRVMAAHPFEEGIQRTGCRAILKLMPCTEAAEYRAVAEHGGAAWLSLQREYRSLARAGVMEGVLAAAAAHRDSAEVQEDMCRVVLCLSRPAVELGEAGGEWDKVGAVMAAMGAHAGHEEVQEVACGALRNLASEAAHQARMLEQEPEQADTSALALILAAMRAHPHSARVQEHACGCLRNLAEQAEQGGAVLAEAGGVRAVLAALEGHAWDARVQEEACGALRHLAFNRRARELMVREGAVGRVVAAMEQHPWQEGVQLEALGALRIVALEAGGVVAEEGGLNGILLAMAEHVASAAVQEEGCGALRNLSAGEEAMRRAIEAAQGVGAVLVAMKGHAWHAGVQEEACAALRNLAMEPEGLRRVARKGAALVVRTALKGHPEHAGVQLHAKALLEALAHREARRNSASRKVAGVWAEGGVGGGDGVAAAAPRHQVLG